MLKRIPKKKAPAPATASSAVATLDHLRETLEMLEKKERDLQRKMSVEVEKAKGFLQARNKRASIECLKRKKTYEFQIEQLANLQLRVHDQFITLEGAKATTDTIDALRSSSSAVKSIQQSLNADDIERALEEANESSESMKQIQEALATPVGSASNFDEDELEAELEELEELEESEEELLQSPSTTVNTEPLPATTQSPPKASSQQASDVDELANLKAQMAL
ncbi:vacuolar protein sorting-associated protein 32 homolog 2-like [Ananas comosus]|uniref:Vacuolar protein sorting-associated protein 32 homolog 2-like n=1 Tax=Ananas comosus TaxID=4615 RepID=A0A6P5FUF5_ANACO|nr:vacuolar protein sorting-associated protein 32 homolog 2-like [Ananas comosus]